MRKRIAFRRLSRTTSHRIAMFRNMVCSLIEHERIVTTEPKAKELKRIADKVIKYAKRWALYQEKAAEIIATPLAEGGGEIAAQPMGALALQQLKLANAKVHQRHVLIKLLHHLGPRYLDRNGGYTRVLKLQKRRAGDAAPMAVIEFVDREGELRTSKPGKGKTAHNGVENSLSWKYRAGLKEPAEL